MTQEEIIDEFCKKEIDNGCYEIKIQGIPVYNLIKRPVRAKKLEENGFSFKEGQISGSIKNRIISILLSFRHLIRLSRRKYKYMFFTFRLENINGVWLDKFYDPIIEECDFLKDDYVILETNRGRRHSQRLHSEHVYYDDAIAIIAYVSSYIYYPYFVCKYKNELEKLKEVLLTLISCHSTKVYVNTIIRNIIRINLYKRLFEKNRPDCIIAASRSNFAPLLCAAKLSKVKFVELQHGISYGPTVTYGGFQDALFTPDNFLAFGEASQCRLYGVAPQNITNIGWAFVEYIKANSGNSNVSNNDVLVLSQPQATDYIVNSLIELASFRPDLNFHLRCHPMEKLSEQHLNTLSKYPNIVIQNNQVPLILAICTFCNVLGEQSTALYESRSYGKKVGVLALNGHKPKFLADADSDYFWIINSTSDFEKFISEDTTKRQSFSIYSMFNQDVFRRSILR